MLKQSHRSMHHPFEVYDLKRPTQTRYLDKNSKHKVINICILYTKIFLLVRSSKKQNYLRKANYFTQIFIVLSSNAHQYNNI